MLCDNCLHKNVCKHTEHFKEYEKQYIEMRKKCSLFGLPIECTCFTKETNKHEYEVIRSVKKLDEEIRIKCVVEEIFNLVAEMIKKLDEKDEIIDFLERVSNIRINRESNDIVKKRAYDKLKEINRDLESIIIN